MLNHEFTSFFYYLSQIGYELGSDRSSEYARSLQFSASSVQAQEALTNNAVQFSVDTIMEFEVTETHGFLQSTFGVINLRWP